MKLTLKSPFFKVLAAVGILFIAYAASVVFESAFWGNALSPLCAAAAAGIIFYAFFKSENRPIRFILLFYAGACLAWVVGDIRWVLIELQNLDPQEDLFATVSYFLTNLLFFISIGVFAIHQFKKWNFLQLFLDTLAISLSSGLLLWSVYFEKDPLLVNQILSDSIFISLSILMDFSIIIGIVIWNFSARTGRVPPYLVIMASGLVVYSAIDLIYYYSYYHGLYTSNSLVDILYMLSLLMLAIGVLFKQFSMNKNDRVEYINNIGFRRRASLLAIFPVVVIISRGFVWQDAVIFALIILIYGGTSKYVQTAIKNEELLRHQMKANEELEKQLSRQDAELATLSDLDPLTKLPNRRYFLDVLDRMVKGRQANQVVTLFYINIDRFKMINDIYGYEIGDKVLIAFSDRLKNSIQEGTVLSRQGGDEFALLFSGEYTRKQIESQAQQLIRLCTEPLFIDENPLHVTIRIGVSRCPVDTTEAIALMKFADIAMYRAKVRGYNRYVFFDPYFNESLHKKHEIEMLLREADIENDFELFFQPQFDVLGSCVVGAEALLRWKDKGQGYISPGDFIPVAEEIGYITKIGAWVMKEAFNQTVKWNTQYGLELKVGINISPVQLNDDNFVKTLKQFIADSNVKTMWLDVEITENIMLSNEPQVNEVFELFRRMGITVSIDDFGTGYSTLNYLKKYPFNRIKIDKSLIDNIASSSSDREIVKAIIGMANSMGIKTIAEGVENKTQLEVLQTLGCAQVQGFLLGRPVQACVFEENYIKKAIIPLL